MTKQLKIGHFRKKHLTMAFTLRTRCLLHSSLTAELQLQNWYPSCSSSSTPDTSQLEVHICSNLAFSSHHFCNFFFPFSSHLSLKNISGAIPVKMQLFYICKAFVIHFKTIWTNYFPNSTWLKPPISPQFSARLVSLPLQRQGPCKGVPQIPQPQLFHQTKS